MDSWTSIIDPHFKGNTAILLGVQILWGERSTKFKMQMLD